MSGAHIAIHAARKRRKEQRQEEEQMTHYSAQELNQDFEFKILRSATGAFGDPDKLDAIMENEARAGWEFERKLDSGRLRLRRPAAARQHDAGLPQGADPYRTRYGIGDWFKSVRLVASIYLAIGIAGIFLWLISDIF